MIACWYALTLVSVAFGIVGLGVGIWAGTRS